MQRYFSSKVDICQLRLYYEWFWLAITLHAEQNKPEVWRLRHTNCKLFVTKITVTVTWAITKKNMCLIYNLKLSLLKRYSMTGWILKKSFLSKIIKNWDVHFSDPSLECFVLVLFLVVLITIYVSTCFSSALDKCNLLEFFTLSTFLWDWWKMELRGGPCDLKWLEERAYGQGGDFLEGEDTPKDTIIIKQANFYI